MDYKIIQYLTIIQLFISHFSTKNDKMYSWKLKGMSEESITPPSTTCKSFYPELLVSNDADFRI